MQDVVRLCVETAAIVLVLVMRIPQRCEVLRLAAAGGRNRFNGALALGLVTLEDRIRKINRGMAGRQIGVVVAAVGIRGAWKRLRAFVR